MCLEALWENGGMLKTSCNVILCSEIGKRPCFFPYVVPLDSPLETVKEQLGSVGIFKIVCVWLLPKIKFRFPETLTDLSLILIFEFRLSWGWKRVTGSGLKDCFHRHHTSCTPQFICRICSHGLRGDGVYLWMCSGEGLLLAKSSRMRTLPVVFQIKQCSDCFTRHSMVDVSNKIFHVPCVTFLSGVRD